MSWISEVLDRLSLRSASESEPLAALGAKHRSRVRRMILGHSAATAVVSSYWAVYFAFTGLWIVVGLQLLAVGAAAVTTSLALHGRMRLASRVLIVAIYLLVCFGAIFIDPPVAGVNRSIHHFLIATGVMSCLLMRAERMGLRRLVPMTCFLTWAAFSSFELGIATSIALPVAARAHTGWVNCFAAILMVYAALHVILTDAAERSAEEGELREALLRGDLLLHYQPQVDAEGQLTGAEALIRWKHPRRGMVPPGDFISLAEKSGLMLPMGTWILKTACEKLVVWSHRPETSSLVMAVNVSIVQFSAPNFVDTVLGVLERSGANPARLKLEVTEGMFAKDLDDIVGKMTRLKAHGVAFSLDDFGTGFSSLSYLRRLPLDQLKIDQSFVSHMLGSKKDAAIVQAVITLGQSMELDVIAEGVETEDQRQFLLALGCTAYQGYLFSRPVAAKDFAAFARRTCRHPKVRVRLVGPTLPLAVA